MVKESAEPEASEKEVYEKILDELLDKINRNGYDSLTAEEKKMLEEVSRYLDKKSDEK